MKFAIAALSALALTAAPAFAGGYDNNHFAGSPQFANSSALNFAVQAGSIHALVSKGNIKQVAGASAEAINKGSCGCSGEQIANAVSKNTSFQVGTIKAGFSVGSINQSGVSTSTAKNVR